MALLFTCAVAGGVSVLFGFAPISHIRVNSLADTLKDGGSRGATSGMRNRVRRMLVVAEVALAVMVTVGAGLLIRSVQNLTAVDAGFNRTHLTTFSITLPAANYGQPVSRLQTYSRLLTALRALPGVHSATAMSGLPPNRPINANDTQIENYVPPPEGPFANIDYYQNVMSDYFDTMGIPIVDGRSFQTSDAASNGMVAIVNEATVRTFWKGQNPIGRRLRPCCGDQIPWFTVIGVAKDVKQGGVDQKTGTEFYRFLEQSIGQAQPLAIVNTGAPVTMNFVLRTSMPGTTLAQAIERAVNEVDRSVPVVRFREMDDVFDDAIRRPRLMANLVSAFAALALLLAAIGTYGVLSYVVEERRREIGIRMALGAGRGTVLAHVMKQGLLLAAIGGAAGLAGALGATRLMTALLFGVKPTDASTLALALVTIASAAAVACAIPAWRASRLDPNVVLRQE
jgi:predicted permease